MARKVTAGHLALRQSEHGSHDFTVPPWELAALDSEGNELYRTEYFKTEGGARAAASSLNSSHPDTPPLPEGVAQFKVVETED